MSKSKMSVVIIFCTIITVTAMIKPEVFTIEGISETKISLLDNIKKINFLSKGNRDKVSQKVTYNDVVQSSEMKVKEVNTGKVEIPLKNNINKSNVPKNSKASSKYGIVLTGEAKKSKINALHESQIEDMKNYYNDKYAQNDNAKKETSKEVSKKNDTKSNTSIDSGDKNETSSDNGDKTDAQVFKVSKEEIKDKLTLSDKQKILSVARKLSPSDYEKINQYINNEDGDQGVIDAVKLLRDRLSDKDYEKIKEVAGKFLNMEVVEKK